MNKLTKQQVENRLKWIEALKSGKYKQVREILKRKDQGYCCLGVACEISGLGKWDGDNHFLEKVSGCVSSSHMTFRVKDHYGFERMSGEICTDPKDHETYWHSLTEYNDTKLYNFQQIAELLENDLNIRRENNGIEV